MKKYLKFLTKRWFWQIFGLLILALLIWFVGPLISIGEFRPLDGLWARIVFIAALAAMLIGTWLWRRWRAKRNAQGLEQAMEAADADPDGSVAELKTLKDRFTRAVDVLKQTRKGKRDLSERWLYELPWYVIIGPPGSGKTTLLAHSGLRFPLADEFGPAVAGIGGTRNCDWFFTDEAVLLDTAGRYVSQDSQPDADAKAWLGFLDLLKKYRPRRPINGVLVAISLADAMSQSDAERQRQAANLRQRISELSERLKVRFPVYLLVTKCDLAAGFIENFEDMSREERKQVWGATFKLADAVEGVDVTARAVEEMDRLLLRLNEQVCHRLHSEPSEDRRARIFAFPQQLASLRETLAGLIRETFRPNPYQATPLLRGVYFTSGTQVGTPVDRLIQDLSERYRLDHPTAAASPAGSGRSYFIGRLFSEIIFPEANLVGTDPKTERRNRWLRYASFAGIALTSLAVVAGWIWSYGENKTAIAEISNDTERFIAASRQIPLETTDFTSLAPALNQLERGSTRFPRPAPMTMGLGLYQGPKVDPGIDDAYHRVLATRLLASVGKRLHGLLRENAAPGPLTEWLKAYLMLRFPDRLDNDYVRGVMATDWALKYPNDPTLVTDLDRHLGAMLDHGFEPLPMDDGLIRGVRNRLAREELWEIIYGQIQDIAREDTRSNYELADLVTRDGDLLFTSSKGGLETVVVPGLYTLKGYQGIFSPESRRLIKQAADDAWVLGMDGDERQFQLDLAEELVTQYSSDYIAVWRGVLDSLRIRPAENIAELVEQVELSASPRSPFREILVQVATETRPAASAREQLATGEAAAAAGSAIEVAAQMNTRVQVLRQRALKLQRAATEAGVETDLFGSTEADVLERIDNRFADLYRLTQERRGKGADLDSLLQGLDELYRFLREFTESGDLDGDDWVRLKESLQSADSPARDLLRRAKRLPNPVRTWIRTLSDDGTQSLVDLGPELLDDLWRNTIVEYCQTAIEGRYPFAPGASREVKLKDFGNFFSPSGKLATFFDTHLQDLVDTTTNPWTWRSVGGADFKGSPESLRELERAERIQAAFFPAGGAAPDIQFAVTPTFLDSASVQVTLDVDGQRITYAHTQPRPISLTWPSAAGAGYARLAFLNIDGQSTAINTTGDWAWFRLLDNAGANRRGDETVDATFRKGRHSAKFRIGANSAFNPLQLRDLAEFKCVPSL